MKNSKPHDSAVSHVTGSAEFIDDRPISRNEVFVDVFYSPVARGRIKNLDVSETLKIPEVLGVYTYKDLKHNLWGSIFADQPYLAEDTVQYCGEAIAVIAATTKDVLLQAKRAIICDIERLDPTLDLQKAIDQKAFIGPKRTIERGQVEAALKNSPHRLTGSLEIAGQDHFYLESQASIAYPKEDGQIEVHSSSQHPSEVQHLVAQALGKKYHEVVCVVKRMGGAFGGKESQAAPFAVFASLVADRLKRPARCVITKDDDMIMTGKRNPFKNFYDVGFDKTGKILALSADLFSDSGAYADLSTAIMERAMLHLDNAYFVENFRVRGQVCKTNTPPTTAFRGFGGPKGVATIENLIEDIARHLDLDAFEVRKVNLYKKGQTTHYGQEIDDNVLSDLFQNIEQDSKYFDWRKCVDRHNSENHSDYRGLSATAVKFGISFTTRFLNQGTALVNLHLDGTVQVSTGATEMGQGVNIKIAQVVASCFGIPVEDVKIMPTSTEKNPNTSATAASSGADLNGRAAERACRIISRRLAKIAKALFNRPKEWRGRAVAAAGSASEIDITTIKDWKSIQFKDKKVIDTQTGDELSFKEVVNEAYLHRVSLTYQGFYRYPKIHFNKETGQGRPFHYYTNGIAASEVSIDKFTGELKVIRTDLYMDLGRPMNDDIDMGQVTGGFVQGMGWVTTENLFYKDGMLVSHSPSTYKIPSVHDVPRSFNCKLIENNLNGRNLKGSKAVGEPPLLLAVSVWTAAKNALQYAKPKEKVALKIPATQEHIYMTMRGRPL